MGSVRAVFSGTLRSSDGVSGVEFALIAPMLLFSFLAMVDVGFALFERMTLDHVLRAGAQSAMGGRTDTEILNVLENTASKNFVVAGSTNPSPADAVSLAVDQYSACPEAPEVEVPPSTVCAGPQPPSIFYELSASKPYLGMFLPEMDLDRLLLVQIR